MEDFGTSMTVTRKIVRPAPIGRFQRSLRVITRAAEHRLYPHEPMPSCSWATSRASSQRQPLNTVRVPTDRKDSGLREVQPLAEGLQSGTPIHGGGWICVHLPHRRPCRPVAPAGSSFLQPDTPKHSTTSIQGNEREGDTLFPRRAASFGER